ncbi:SDR family NAD(P)-dependent oxidoreductase [Rhodococcus sp. 3Y1]
MSAPVAIVTGAAAGLGAAIAERLAEDFGTLLLLDIEEAALADTAARLESLGVAVHTARCDVRREGDVKNAFDVAASAGSPTALVNGAGIGVFTPFPRSPKTSGTTPCGEHQGQLPDVPRIREQNRGSGSDRQHRVDRCPLGR